MTYSAHDEHLSVARRLLCHAEGFRRTLMAAATAAEAADGLVTVGIVPVRADPGFGYIEPGEPLVDGVRRVARFVEKPTRERAAEMQRQGYLWNSGIFVWRVGTFLSELQAHSPEIGPALAKHSKSLKRFFGAVKTPIAVDHAVLERSSRVLVLAGDFGWDDVGTWDALHRVRAHDPDGNASHGPVHVLEASNNVVHSEGPQVVLYGVSNLVVVVKDGLALVTSRERATELKKLVESLPKRVQSR